MNESERTSQDSGLEVEVSDKFSQVRQTPRHHARSASADYPGNVTTLSHSKDDAHTGPRKSRKDYLQIAGSAVSHLLETFFYNLGHGIASRPWTVILCCLLISLLSGLGMIKFETKDNGEQIWVPEQSNFIRHQRWVEEKFPGTVRTNVLIVTADNILSPGALQEMARLDQMVKALSEYNNSVNDIYNFNWTSICFSPKDQCYARSILELWQYDMTKLNALESTAEIVSYMESLDKSPMFGDRFDWRDWLGDLTYNAQRHVISAKAAKMVYLLKATTPGALITNIAAPDLLWETKFVKLARAYDEKEDSRLNSVDVQAVRSFRDEYENSYQADIVLLSAGIVIIICYVAVVIGKFNEVEHKVYLALIGVVGIALAILVSYGLASALGHFYGPIHPLLPFLLLGLGVDDMFVIIEAWNNLSTAEQQKELPERMALTMKHAGVSITVTSVTNLVAFAIGSSTVLPALKSFCVYAALGVLFLFILQSTFFVAWLTIDQRRQDATRDACCIWIKYYNFEANACSQRQFLPWIIRQFVAPALTSLPIKTLVMTMVLCVLALSGYGMSKLKTESDISWFLSPDSYFTRFLNQYESSFDEGTPANLYLGNIPYHSEGEKIERLVSDLYNSSYIQADSIRNWHADYRSWLKTERAEQIAAYYLKVPLSDGVPGDSGAYYKLLNIYVGAVEQQYYPNLRWNDSNPNNTRHVVASTMELRFIRIPDTKNEVKCLNFIENFTASYYGDQSFIWSAVMEGWETNRVIAGELYTNLGLAFLAVFVVTLFLVANIWVCVLVCLSVVLSVVNVCGMMYFWGLTIDTLTSILLILAMGLAIDYSAHIGHTFMTMAGSRHERVQMTVATIGPAIINGGFSTFLAFALLATSDSYAFITFFKVFFLVVVFGLFNGLGFLPILLSWVGPMPYLNATQRVINSSMSISLKEITGSRRTDIDKFISGTNSNLTQATNVEKVEQFIEGLPEHEQALLPDGSYAETSRAERLSDVDQMLAELERQAAATPVTGRKPSARNIEFRDPDDVVANCELYLSDKGAK